MLCYLSVVVVLGSCVSQNGRLIKIQIDFSEGLDIASCNESKKCQLLGLDSEVSCLDADRWRF